jgi:Domain of unknown function (DUF5916)/Carbohydrate family 9 binding domain-like
MLRTSLSIAIAAIAVAGGAASAGADVLPTEARARAVRRAGPVVIDGRLDEAVWRDAPHHAGFTQRFPKEGAKASYETSFAVLYDDSAIYVGVWADDPEPHKVRRTLTRRDVEGSADAIAVGIDSYHDRRTAYVFQLNAAGVQRDLLLFDDSQGDDTWDAVWTGDAVVSDRGWTAEYRIPLNQLRFVARESQEWGFQVLRIVARTREEVSWSPWPRTTDEVVSKFGVVGGIERLRPGRRLELLPYATGGFEAMPVEAGDPLNESFAGRGNVGLDLKYGLGPAFTLSATINPDFGQVEADPSQVNLSANELFFAEKRPFFIEGVDLFKLPIGTSDGSAEGVFYSRRIGAAPSALPDDYEYIRAPTSTTIYGAAKLTGKTRGGWSVGMFDAVTGQETATIVDEAGAVSRPVVAPLTNYTMARVKRDLRGGKTYIGASATAVHRSLAGTGLEELLHDQAYTAGAQLSHKWAKDAWIFDLRTVGSFVHGTEEAIAETQTSQRHLFQRPDARTFRLDPTRTSLSGFGATWKLGQMGNTKHWRYMFGGDLRTAGLELNDMGFQFQSDRVIPFWWVQYHDETPGKQILNYDVSADVFLVGDELAGDPRLMDYGLECNGNVQFANHWRFGYFCNLVRSMWVAGALRGGPSLHVDPRGQVGVFGSTDPSKPVWVSLEAGTGRDPTSDSIDGFISAGVTIQARANVDVFLGPSYSYRNEAMQYVEEAPDELSRPHYVFARLNQTTASMTMRVNWTFSPRLSLQGYAQPFVSTGRYSEYKDVTQAGAQKFSARFVPLGGANLMLAGDDTFTATNDGTFSFSRPDFSFRQLRSTVVLRWEYRPGSSVFAIWSHGRTSDGLDGRFNLGRDLRSLGETDAENVVMVKANYWIGL